MIQIHSINRNLLSKFPKFKKDFITLINDEINKFRFRVGLTELSDKRLINCVPMWGKYGCYLKRKSVTTKWIN